MNENLTVIIVTVISVAFGTGGWKFYEFLIRNRREVAKEAKSEQTIYRDDLISRVVKLENNKDNCKDYLMEIEASLVLLSVKIDLLEKENEMLKLKLSN